MSDTNNVTEAELLNFTQEMSHLRLTPNPSPGGTPKPPANSLRTSSENLLGLDQTTESTLDYGNVDLLGLSADEQNANVDNSIPASYVSSPVSRLIKDKLSFVSSILNFDCSACSTSSSKLDDSL
jgi:hypothetical protein